MEGENRDPKLGGVYSHKLRAGKRRTYFVDVRSTKYDDFFISITESKKKGEYGGYESHKIFLYKEDFNKFQKALNGAIDYIKESMPDFDYEAFDHPPERRPEAVAAVEITDEVEVEDPTPAPSESTVTEETAVADPTPEVEADEDTMGWDS